ncbi:MAG: hypothetical protein H0T18_00805, partial [Chloroflexia bacterium]|nr:hypothetical protein [Chloroflexia bacterium]
MPPEHPDSGAAPHPETALPVVDGAPPRGCKCGRGRSPNCAPSLLTDDLVIASRARAREPELPEATVARALATPVSSRQARYDVVVLTSEPDDTERDTRIAAEFARHEHRVFHFRNDRDRRPPPAAPILRRLPPPADVAASLEALAALRESEAIE